MEMELNPRLSSVGPAGQDERRGADRFAPVRPLPCQLTAVVREGEWPARVRDLSTSGVGLLVPLPFTPGAILGIDLANRVGRFVRFLLVQVLHCRREAEGAYFLGGEFVGQLSAAELSCVVACDAPAVSGAARLPAREGA
jgi:PilZ domain